MLDPKVIERVLDRRSVRGASDESLIAWLQSLKAGVWKSQPLTIDGFIDAIKSTPLPKEEPLVWDKLWAAMEKDPERWIPTTEKMYWDMLECLPPAAHCNGAFLVGEPNHHNEDNEAVYACFKKAGEEFIARYMTLLEFKDVQLVRS